MFGTFAVLYLFCGGTGAGAIAVCSLADLAWARQPFGTGTYTQGPSVRPEARIVDSGSRRGLALLVLGIACLLLDLGRLDRVLMLFLNPQPTFITVGAFALAALALLGGFLAAVRFLYVPAVRRAPWRSPRWSQWWWPCWPCCTRVCCCRRWVASRSGRLPSCRLLFLLSSLSGGMALVLLAALFVERTPPTGQLTGFLARADLLVVVLEIACVAGFLLWRRRVDIPACGLRLRSWRKATWRARGGSASARAGWPCRWAWRLRAGRRARCGAEAWGWNAAFAVAAALVLVGGWCLRWSMVEAGVHRELELESVPALAAEDVGMADALAPTLAEDAGASGAAPCVAAPAPAPLPGDHAVALSSARAASAESASAVHNGVAGFAVCFGRGGRLRDGERRRVRSWRAKVRRGAWQ